MRLLALTLTLGSVGCAGSERTSDQTAELQRISIRSSADDLPSGCSAADVTGRLVSFFRDVNSGSTGTVDEYFAGGDASTFQWFSFTDSTSAMSNHVLADSPESLRAYFGSDVSSSYDFRLRGIEIIGWVEERQSVSFAPVLFEYKGHGEAGVLRTFWGRGKGELHCPSRTFIALSLGTVRHELWSRALGTLESADSAIHGVDVLWLN